MKFFKITDIIIIVCILAVSGALMGIYKFFISEDEVKAELYYYNDLITTVDLSQGKERLITIPQDNSILLQVYEDGSIAFIESDCPDKVCIQAGRISKTGQFAACLPNGVVMKIVPEKESDERDVDLVIGQ
ncbi:MAG: NusG domain II-containing protein [Eubacteriales bacterium]|nr:NusG domain II-containing protein [Eubacteriales bacterium]